MDNGNPPLQIKRQDTGLSVRWDSSSEVFMEARTLRVNCPCAECREARGDTSHAQPLTTRPRSLRVLSATAAEELNLVSVWPVGNYAIGLSWGDGHKTGIYRWSYLRELSASKPQ